MVDFAEINPLLNVAAYWQSSDTEACVNKLSQILANNIDNGRSRIYVRCCRFNIKTTGANLIHAILDVLSELVII